MKRWVASLALGLVLAGGLAAGLQLTSGTSAQWAPAFTLPALGGGAPVAVPVRVGGMRLPVVVTFFASWCSSCLAELPMIAAEADRLEAAGTEIAFVGVDGNDDPASGLAFSRRSGVRFPVGSDAVSDVAPTFGVPGYPATVFVDAAGVVVHVVRGPVSRATLDRWATRIARRPHTAERWLR